MPWGCSELRPMADESLQVWEPVQGQEGGQGEQGLEMGQTRSASLPALPSKASRFSQAHQALPPTFPPKRSPTP